VDATANLLALVILASVQSAKNVLATAASVLIANVMEKPNLDAAKRKRLHAVKKRKNPAAARNDFVELSPHFICSYPYEQ